ncbi:hypothetical protein SADUNF_Sadunf16G0273800 [Salix dunnii]|uniref:Uncharacterized protein n=1 Tax=Salix dunnii TaxID=1413687 RepID=A0A835JCE3_9ROSI|nr:hypothetical protein SADUNF_Sadunf16G0273800 [Salix dunnii]
MLGIEDALPRPKLPGFNIERDTTKEKQTIIRKQMLDFIVKGKGFGGSNLSCSVNELTIRIPEAR